jgi:hypothetical protein
MRRIISAIVLTTAVLSFQPKPAQAGEGPWCAFISTGTGSVYEDCQYWSFEACRPNVLAGNRGFCNLNPRYQGPVVTAHRHVRHRRHYE